MGNESHENPKRVSRANIALIGFLVIAAFYLITEHRAHVLGYLPFLILLACPLLHIFMHGGHGGHGDSDSTDQAKEGRSKIGHSH